jgi:hypothetical protein
LTLFKALQQASDGDVPLSVQTSNPGTHPKLFDGGGEGGAPVLVAIIIIAAIRNSMIDFLNSMVYL